MILNVGLGANLGAAADKATSTEGDDITIVPNTLLPVEKLLSPHTFTTNVSSTARIARTSFFDHLSKNRAASTGASDDTLVVLTRGLWTLWWNLNAKFQASGSLGVAPAINLILSIPELNDTRNLHQVFRMATFLYWAHGEFRILVRNTAELRLNIGATGVGDAIDCAVSFGGEKNI